MWQAIPAVGSGLSLVAFVVAAIVYAYRAKLDQRAKIIATAPEKRRSEAIEQTADSFRLDLRGLTKEQRQELALATIDARLYRDGLVFRGILAIALMLAVVAIVSIWLAKPTQPLPAPPVPPPKPDLKTQLVGQYQVRLGPKGGCNGGRPNSSPAVKARITTDGTNFTAINECNDQSTLSIAGNGHTIFFYNEQAEIAVGTPTLTFTDQLGNTWEKLP